MNVSGDTSGLDRETTVEELLRIFRRQARFILTVVIVFTTPVAIYAFSLEAKYTAVASVVVEPRPQLLLLADGSPAAPPPDPAYLETLSSVIRSSALTSRTMAELDLFSDPEFQPSSPGVIERLGFWLSGSSEGATPSESPNDIATLRENWLETMAIFDDRLEVRPQNQS